MALVVDQQSSFKHFCKICKKGFMCGRALGGHMRAHGIGDEGEAFEDDDPASDWEDKSVPPGNKRMYALRTNPNRLRSCRSCENCGKEFISWKSFLEHGNGKCCSSDDADSLLSSPTGSEDGESDPRRASGWFKRKRSFRANVGHPSEEEDLANCLMMLSNATVDSYSTPNPISFIAPLMTHPTPLPALDYKAKGVSNNPKGLFECKACKKVFNSHQALGGHRASHKKVKGCFASRLDNLNINNLDGDHIGDDEYNLSSNGQEFMRPSKSSCITLQHNKGKSKVHECSICHRVFSSGQALGGHKRCHWITSNAPDPFTRFRELQMPILAMAHSEKTLDLNLSTSKEETTKGVQRDPGNPFGFDVSTEILLQSWGGVNGGNEQKQEHNQNQKEGKNENEEDDQVSIDNNEDIKNNIMLDSSVEEDNKIKLAKLSELKDHMGTNGGSGPWLQVGIGSSATVGAQP